MIEHIKRGEIYLADLNPYIGSEQGGTGPVLILQNDIGNYFGPTVIVAALTTQSYKSLSLPTHIIINKREKLHDNSIVLLEQIRTIDKMRLREYIALLMNTEIKLINKALKISVAIE